VNDDGGGGGLWARLEEQFGLVSLRPMLSPDVRVRHIGEEHELLEVGTGRLMSITAEEAATVEMFDGEQTVAEMVVQGMQAGELSVEPVLSLIDRLVRAEMLEQYPPDLYRQLENHLARLRSGDMPLEDDVVVDDEEEVRTGPEGPADVDLGGPIRSAEGPWRARSPAIAERARFLRGVSMFASLDLQSIGALADATHEENWPAHSYIISEGAHADRFFLVRSGEVTVEKRDAEHGEFQQIAELGPGDWFGEAALIEGAPRNAQVRAGARPVLVYSFDSAVFDRYIRPHVVARHSDLISKLRAQLDEVPLFQALASPDLDRLARVLREVEVAKGSILFRQGDVADEFYVIVEGSVGVVKDGKPIAKLLAGEFFGETALLFTDARTATIAATDDCRFWVLDRESFQTFLRDALLHRRDLMPVVLNRLASTDPV
jgi:CRP-like cAMP-binding protein